MRRTLPTVALAACCLAPATSVHADLTGTEMLIDILHEGLISGDAGGIHMYGRTDSFFTDQDFELIVFSPADAPGYDNAVAFDFSDFYLSDLSLGATGQVSIMEIDENVASGSVAVLAGGNDITATALTFQNGLVASWNVNDVMANTTEGPIVTIAWNSVPSPGAVALLGLAALASRRRPRRP